MNNEFFYLGTITRTFGYHGQVIVYLDTDEPEKYRSLRAVFIAEGDEFIPYMIDDIRIRSDNTAIVRFADVDGETALSLQKSELYLPLSDLPPLTGNKFYYHEVIGFSVIDAEKGYIGVCRDFIDVSNHSIMKVNFNGTEILIPAVDDIFDTVDREHRTITIHAPEGLIDIYLS